MEGWLEEQGRVAEIQTSSSFLPLLLCFPMTPPFHQQGTPHAQRLSEPPNLQGQSRWGWCVTGHGLGMS